MEKFDISLVRDKQIFQFEVRDYVHHNGDQCKFEVYKDDAFVASFEPDGHDYLHVCKNPGKLEEELLHLIADKLEAYHIHQPGKDDRYPEA